MKKLLSILVVLLLAFACFAKGTEEVAQELTPVQKALKDAATLSWDELVAKAKAEIGDNELILISNTSEFDEPGFTAKTGIKVKRDALDSGLIVSKLATDVGAGAYCGDVAITGDSVGVLGLLDEGLVENFIPAAVSDKLIEEAKYPYTSMYSSRLFGYNNGNGTIENRLYNIWQLTEPEFKGFEMKNPLTTTQTLSWFITLTSEHWQNEIAKAYKSYYGKDWVNTGKFKNISYEWVYKIIQNITLGTKDGTIVTNLENGKAGSLGMAVYSKLGKGKGITVSAFEGVEGFAGYLYPQATIIASNTKYPYAAACYISYIASEEGFNNCFGGVTGVYSTNPDVELNPVQVKAGDKTFNFWKDYLVVEDSSYVDTVYAEAFTIMSQWLAEKSN